MAGDGFLLSLWKKPIWEGVWPYLDPMDRVCLRTASMEWNVPGKYGPHGELFFFLMQKEPALAQVDEPFSSFKADIRTSPFSEVRAERPALNRGRRKRRRRWMSCSWSCVEEELQRLQDSYASDELLGNGVCEAGFAGDDGRRGRKQLHLQVCSLLALLLAPWGTPVTRASRVLLTTMPPAPWHAAVAYARLGLPVMTMLFAAALLVGTGMCKAGLAGDGDARDGTFPVDTCRCRACFAGDGSGGAAPGSGTRKAGFAGDDHPRAFLARGMCNAGSAVDGLSVLFTAVACTSFGVAGDDTPRAYFGSGMCKAGFAR